MLRRALVAVSLVLAASCGNEGGNPFAALISSRPPSADAALLFVSGSWAESPGQARELFALDATGSRVERLTRCSESSAPCDFLQVAPSSDRDRVMAIRTTPGAEAGTSTAYYMDLSRAVETVVFPRRRVDAIDWSPDGSFVVFSAVVPQTSQEDLFYSSPNGQGEENLTQSPTVRERAPRIDPGGQTAVFERIDESGVGRIYVFANTPVTSGPATGPALPGTPYVVGCDADPVFSPDRANVAFRRLTGVGNGGLGTWDLLTVRLDGTSTPTVLATGPLYRGAPDWGRKGILYVETDAAASSSQLVLVQADGTGRTVLRTEDAGFGMGSPRWLPGS
jgi:Tol biopolymer transport system component